MDPTADPKIPTSRWRRLVKRVSDSTQNALEVMRVGRLGAPYSAPYEIRYTGSHYRLRRYLGEDSADKGAPILLVPPLMVASEVYDIAPDISAVGALLRGGVDVWLVDFGAPEEEEDGMSRTLDDHVLAIHDAIERIHAHTGHNVHLAGYSQGGMFVYQVAAYRRTEHVASLITFGSPVDFHRNLPAIHDTVSQQIIGALRVVIEKPLAKINGLPGVLTSVGFKLVSVRKEAQQLVDFVRKLHDRQALERRESRRIFLGGEGFIAWPGPALRQFIDDMIVHNRMTSGGFVIDGRTVTLADLDVPILCFIGSRDEIVRPPAVRAIHRAAPHATIHEVVLEAGHFGLVVGSNALKHSWPAVMDWMHWINGDGPRPSVLDESSAPPTPQDGSELQQLLGGLNESARTVWKRLGERAVDAGESIEVLRTQVPRLKRLRSIHAGTRISSGLLLAEQARLIPERPFFIWRDRAFSYAQANERVDSIVRGLIHCGVRPRQRIGVLMTDRPSHLSLITAINRLGAVAVLLSTRTRHLERALALGGVEALITDPEHAAQGRAATTHRVLMLGGGGRRMTPEGVTDMEQIDPLSVTLPDWYQADPGRARDLAMLIVSGREDERLQVHEITHHRWAFSAIGAAVTCALSARDTIYSCLPLHHPSGVLVTAGSALVGGCRLALSDGFDPNTFWSEVRRYGASVAFYAGEMCRALIHASPQLGEHHHPLRLLAGSGMPADVWESLHERFGEVSVIEFYASTEGNAVLANTSGKKRGAIGRPIPSSSEIALIAYDPRARALVTNADGALVRCHTDEIGVLISRLELDAPLPRGQVRADVFNSDDRWLISGDLARCDSDGDFWFFDRLQDVLYCGEDMISTAAVEAVLYQSESILRAAVYVVEVDGRATPIAAVTLRDELSFADLTLIFSASSLPPAAWPQRVRVMSSLPMNEGFRVLKNYLRAEGIDPQDDSRWLSPSNPLDLVP